MDGVWTPLGAPALVDWCEPNYLVTPWLAELWNTVSSLLIVAMGVFGFWRCRDSELRGQPSPVQSTSPRPRPVAQSYAPPPPSP